MKEKKKKKGPVFVETVDADAVVGHGHLGRR